MNQNALDKNNHALIAGATGLVGGHLLDMLLKQNIFNKIHLLVRRPLNINHLKVEQHIIDFDKLDNLQINAPIDTLFCTLGTTLKTAGSIENFKQVDFNYVINLGMLAKRLNIESFVVISSLGANAHSYSYYLKTKGEMEQGLIDLGLKHLTIVRPSLLAGKRNEFRLKEVAGNLGLKLIAPLLVGPLKKYRPVSALWVARAMIHFGLRPRNESEPSFIESDQIAQMAAHK